MKKKILVIAFSCACLVAIAGVAISSQAGSAAKEERYSFNKVLDSEDAEAVEADFLINTAKGRICSMDGVSSCDITRSGDGYLVDIDGIQSEEAASDILSYLSEILGVSQDQIMFSFA